jgi:hypothetical protein
VSPLVLQEGIEKKSNQSGTDASCKNDRGEKKINSCRGKNVNRLNSTQALPSAILSAESPQQVGDAYKQGDCKGY